MPSPKVEPQTARWRTQLKDERATLQQQYLAKKLSAASLLRRHRQRIDKQLLSIWKNAGLPTTLTLIAGGGYGRGELYPHSDIDLLILLPDNENKNADAATFNAQLETFIGTLWDIGLEVGHSVRTVAECLALAQQNISVQTNLLETRLLAGDQKLFDDFTRAFRKALNPQDFYRAKQLEQEQRHARYHDTNLEPNLKESAGGLRELHQILWVAHAAGIGTQWRDLVAHDILTRREATQLRRHENFLQNLRIRLHYLTGRHEDRLIFDVQNELAAQLNYRDSAHRRASEHMMQDFYRTAREVRQINTIVLQNIGATIFPKRNLVTQKLNDHFQTYGDLLEVASDQEFQRAPIALLEAFLLLQQHPELKGMTAQTLRALWRARDNIQPAFRNNAEHRAQFLEILRAPPERVMPALRLMHDYGVLGRYMPAFDRITGQMQHDLYHVYTVDEHILKVMNNVVRFAIPEFSYEFPLSSRLISEFAQPELLYLAALFHDIAKGRGGDHSKLGKADALRFCRAHGLPKEDAELVAWLVENHLVMSATAQKQDLSDPDVITTFAKHVGNERRLAALYILTVADIRGTSPKVWNVWKAKLLEDLFHAASRHLRGDVTTLDGSMQQRLEAAHAKLRLYAIEDNAYAKFWARLDTAYFLRHSADEIAWHTRLLFFRKDLLINQAQPVIKARLSPAGEGLQVMVHARDRRELFARICSFFERISYSIVEAKIYTTRDGYALDSFQILDPHNKRPQYRDLINYIEHELTRLLVSDDPLPPLLPNRPSRQLKHFPITPRVHVQPDERGDYYALNIVAGDRPGLLSRIARCLVQYNLSLNVAKINTLGDRAEDVFLIKGDALKNTNTVVKLESELAQQLA